MSTIKVIVDLPFFLQLEKSLTVPYEKVCKESLLPELKGRKVKITFSRKLAGDIDKSEWTKVRSTLTIKVSIPVPLSDESIDTFAINNCREIINNIISSYQATTLQVDNAGFIIPLGTSYMQLFAEILVNGKDIRDRYPSYSTNTFPLTADRLKEFKQYLRNKDKLPLSRLFLTNASLSLNQGQYSLAVLQAAIAVELRLTQFVVQKLKLAGWIDQAIKPYKEMTLGRKLNIPQTDPRSLETYLYSVSGFAGLYEQIRKPLNKLRNDVAHDGYLPSYQEAIDVVEIASKFLRMVA